MLLLLYYFLSESFIWKVEKIQSGNILRKCMEKLEEELGFECNETDYIDFIKKNSKKKTLRKYRLKVITTEFYNT